MDEFITLVIIFILIGLVDKFLKAVRKAKAPPPEVEPEAEERAAIEGLPRSLQDLIAQELGLDLERRPKVEPPAQPGAAPADAAWTAVPAPPRRPREVRVERPRESRPPTVVHPGEREAERERRRQRALDRAGAAPERMAVLARREPAPPEEAISLEELGMRERGAPVSLEVLQRPEERERLRDRYARPERIRARRRRHVQLPEPPGWSAAQKAIVWAELLGPPKGLTD